MANTNTDALYQLALLLEISTQFGKMVLTVKFKINLDHFTTEMLMFIPANGPTQARPLYFVCLNQIVRPGYSNVQDYKM